MVDHGDFYRIFQSFVTKNLPIDLAYGWMDDGLGCAISKMYNRLCGAFSVFNLHVFT